MFSLANVSKKYGLLEVISPTSFKVPLESCLVILGPSGSGKSTLLRLMLGLIWPDQGQIFFGDTVLSPETIKDIRSRIGYVIQGGGLFPHLSARQNVILPAQQRKWSAADIESRLDKLCQIARFPQNRLSHYPTQLSGGEKQRVSLMRALMLDPEVLLLDEPLGALDPQTRSELQRELKELFTVLAKTVVLVTHDLWEASFFSDQVLLMDKGRIQYQGTFDDFIKTNSLFVQAYPGFQPATAS